MGPNPADKSPHDDLADDALPRTDAEAAAYRRKVAKSKTRPRGRPPAPTPARKEKVARAEDHMAQLALVRDGQIFGRRYADIRMTFMARGWTLSRKRYGAFLSELHSEASKAEFFAKEATRIMEEDHILSLHRIRAVENRLLREFDDVASTDYYTYAAAGAAEQRRIITAKNELHDAPLLVALAAQISKIQETKARMMAASPLVVELAQIRHMQEQEASLLGAGPHRSGPGSAAGGYREARHQKQQQRVVAAPAGGD